MIEITTPSRLHITLIGLNASIGRVDGGIGLALKEPGFRITAERSDVPGEVTVTSEAAGGAAHVGRMRESAAALLPDGNADRGGSGSISSATPPPTRRAWLWNAKRACCGHGCEPVV